MAEDRATKFSLFSGFKKTVGCQAPLMDPCTTFGSEYSLSHDITTLRPIVNDDLQINR